MEPMLCRLFHKQKFLENSAQELISLSHLEGVSIRDLLPDLAAQYSSDYDLGEASVAQNPKY
jgi:hypothetical protein